MSAPSLDLVTRVVDHYGDAGVALRLGRQLHREYGVSVTLWIDDVATLARIAPGLRATSADQRYAGMRIRRLEATATPGSIADGLVELFGCGLPAPAIAAMAGRARPPVWIVLEYLSAEEWVDGAHGKPSPHPATGLPRWFFFPGFTPATGGLLRERDLFAQREAFARDPDAKAAAWASLGLADAAREAFCVALFCYPNAALPALFDAWATGPRNVLCAVPSGIAQDAVRAMFAAQRDFHVRGALTLAIVPFVDQSAFDRRLWASDFCIVRGEDSFLRAQWAVRPFAWHIYPQEAGAHHAKLGAFLARYAEGLDAGSATALRRFHTAFNEADARALPAAWSAVAGACPALAAHARDWAAALARQDDLAHRLMAFILCRLA